MKEYLQYTVEEFALEASFINWVRDTNSADSEFWEQWLLNNPNKEEELARAKLLVGKIKFKESKPIQEREDAVWNKIKSSISNDATGSKEIFTRRRFMPWIGVAAAMVMTLIYFSIGMDSTYSISTSIAQIEKISLPEGSIVDLNANSSLQYDKEDFNEDRVLSLTGEAFFKVQKGSSFRVKTEYGVVEVLGTSFNIFARGDQFKVSCQSGKVAVRSDGGETILIANEMVEIVGIQAHQKKVNDAIQRSDWRNGIYNYSGELLMNIVKDMERHLNIDVTLQNGISSLQFSGSFHSEDLETALSEVCWPLGLSYDIEGNKVRIFKK